VLSSKLYIRQFYKVTIPQAMVSGFMKTVLPSYEMAGEEEANQVLEESPAAEICVRLRNRSIIGRFRCWQESLPPTSTVNPHSRTYSMPSDDAASWRVQHPEHEYESQ
jgi:hypothetical protein